jgi:hypothetical protein
MHYHWAMKQSSQSGTVAVVVTIVLLATALVGALGFGAWAFAGRSDYKNNSDAKAAAAADKAVKEAGVKKDAEFAEKEKSPYRTYNGPAAFGSVQLTYPKTWSAYVIEKADNASLPVDGYFNVSYVQDTGSKNPFALRLQVDGAKYEAELASLENQVKTGKGKTTAYRLPKVPSVLGVRFEGVVSTSSQKQGVMVMLPMRDKVLKVWTEGTANVSDLNDVILPNLSFVP